MFSIFSDKRKHGIPLTLYQTVKTIPLLMPVSTSFLRSVLKFLFISRCLDIFPNVGEHQSFLLDHCFSVDICPGFYSLHLCALSLVSDRFLRLTSGATAADLLIASMAANCLYSLFSNIGGS